MRLAELANVLRPVVQDFEAKGRVPIVNNLLAIRMALEAAGVRLRYLENGEAIFFPDKSADESGTPGGDGDSKGDIE